MNVFHYSNTPYQFGGCLSEDTLSYVRQKVAENATQD